VGSKKRRYRNNVSVGPEKGCSITGYFRWSAGSCGRQLRERSRSRLALVGLLTPCSSVQAGLHLLLILVILPNPLNA
jgi:hypothetical protein